MRKRNINILYSICPVCYKKIKARIIFREGKVFISKRCPTHGKFIEEHIWNDSETYKFMFSNSSLFLQDTGGIHPHGLIVDITPKCNLTCSFCFKKNYPDEDSSSLLMKIKKASKKMHFSTLFLFGGEPTLRKDLFFIIKELKRMNLDVSLFTNGIKLKNQNYVRKLKIAGLDSVTLSLDSLDDNVYKKIRNAKLLKTKLLTLKNLRKFKISTSLFVVATNLNTTQDIVGIINLKLKFPNLHTIYLSTVTREGVYLEDVIPVPSSQRINILSHHFRMKKEEIYATTTFERLIVEFLYKYLKRPIKYSSPFCDLVCYFYATGKHLIPLTKIVDLEAVNKELTSNIMKKSSILKIGVRIFRNFVFKSLFLRICFSLFKSLIISKGKFKISIPPLFLRVIITRFQDKHNLDLRSFKTCNLYSLSAKGEVKPFCARLNLEREEI